ncbi:hypothetical protein [Pseudomonas gingeri]|uniref:Uncharacterized protein n=1 Tax=Pseudomonas gingeri TaxID=117681 RepID=A0A7Y8CMM3_9PSED|nr:hypothetical protein [Pseudomonas gingeri]NWC35825.1 hypothetical protein [Pseudomonas gingeri]NWE32866.1 hypothetical protein [Pseudomonas gingeri]
MHIEFLAVLCKLWGPCKSLVFSPRDLSGHQVVDVSYVDDHSKTCWTVTLYKNNAEELQRLLPPKT